MSKLHPIFQSITDGFLGSPEKVAGASPPANVIEHSAQDQEASVPYCDQCGISHSADSAHPAGTVINSLSGAAARGGMSTSVNQAYELGRIASGGDRSMNPYAREALRSAWFDGFDGVQRR